mmetsp:Transcript_9825/g.13900  ORF Transcript_9825/g.13900 Transcript_9825/m.13900 type:complete len:96 (-) Transcript_9825:885-1172(-)
MCIQWKRHLLTIALSATVLISTCYASNFNEPHVHNGKVSPFKPGDPNVPLDANAIKILKSGKPYQVRRHVLILVLYEYIYITKCQSQKMSLPPFR